MWITGINHRGLTPAKLRDTLRKTGGGMIHAKPACGKVASMSLTEGIMSFMIPTKTITDA